MKPKLVRITTVPTSLKVLLKGQLKFMSNNGFDVIGISSKGILLTDLEKEEEISVFSVEMSRRITPIKDLVAVFNLFIYFIKHKPLIVHTHTPKAGTVGMIAAKIARVPIRLHTVAGLPLIETSGIKRTILNLVEKLTYACSTKVYPNSIGLKKIIEQNHFCKTEKLKVILNGSSNGIDTSFFNPDLFSIDSRSELKDKLNIDSKEFVFIYVGRLVGDKGINELVKAFEAFQIENVGIKLLLVGDYEAELDPLEYETIKVIENNANIISVGHQKDVRPYLAISNCLVFPSYREGFPNVVMQAGAMGLPSIVSDINGCNEIIKDGVNGIIIPVKNKSVLLDKMKELFKNKIYNDHLKKNARTMIVSRYEQEAVWQSILLEYKNHLKDKIGF
jgi:glycosyltransferase involved in cell wall biosynthesis